MPAGRPPEYTEAAKMQEAIDAYFETCQGKPYIDDNGDPLIDKNGNYVMVGAKPPTVTGLALALGFNTRLSLINYQGKPEFMNTVTRAKTRIEEYAEARLFDRDGVQGARFSLSNNFNGWAEKADVNMNLSQSEAAAKVKAMVDRAREKPATSDI